MVCTVFAIYLLHLLIYIFPVDAEAFYGIMWIGLFFIMSVLKNAFADFCNQHRRNVEIMRFLQPASK